MASLSALISSVLLEFLKSAVGALLLLELVQSVVDSHYMFNHCHYVNGLVFHSGKLLADVSLKSSLVVTEEGLRIPSRLVSISLEFRGVRERTACLLQGV